MSGGLTCRSASMDVEVSRRNLCRWAREKKAGMVCVDVCCKPGKVGGGGTPRNSR